MLGHAHGGKTPAQVALNWLICKGAVPIPGAKNAAQVSAVCWGCVAVTLAAHVRGGGSQAAPWPDGVPSCCPQAQSNVGALGWRLTEGDVAELDELAIEGSLKFGQHG